MAEDTAQSLATADPIAGAAEAFKNFDPEAVEAPQEERRRNEKGQFAKADETAETEEVEEIEAEAEVETEAEADAHEEGEEAEAADEAQPEPLDLPTSWPSEKAELWSSLDPDAQAYIRQRDAEQSAAVNAKFQEAANVKKANEALIAEADANRKYFTEAAEFALQLVAPQAPSESMLDPRSGDYNPDAYHLAKARHERLIGQLGTIQQQREAALAQQEAAAEQARQQRVSEINQASFPALVKDVPDLADPAKADGAFMELARYALSQGVPAETPLDSFLAPELHLLWKAQQYDKMKAAQSKVAPKAAKPAAPPVRPGVTTPRSAVMAAEYRKASDKLAETGSIKDGAAIWKHFLKG